MKDLILIGASGVCHEIIDTVFDINAQSTRWSIAGILDDDEAKWGETLYDGVRVIGGREQIRRFDLSKTEFLIAFSSPLSFLKRDACAAALSRDHPDIQFARIIHPRAAISRSATIGTGSFIGLGAIVDARAVVGRHCLVLYNSVVSRRVEVGDFSFISSSVNITGDKRIGRSTYLGVKSTVNANIRDKVLVSAGSLVMRDVPENCIVFNERKQEVISFETTGELQATLEQLP